MQSILIADRVFKKNFITQSMKFSGMLGLIFIYIIHSLILKIFYKDIWTFRRKIIFVMSSYCKFSLKLIGIRVKKYGKIESPFVVSNHLSYLDILVLASLHPTAFVTSVEIREMPGLGLLTELGGCLFVERRSRANLSKEIQDLTNALNKNIPVTIFPEATSTNAESVLRFKRPLFQASQDSGKSVTPICINYLKVDGEYLNKQNRDTVCWYGSMDFLPHLWKLMEKREILVEIRVLNSLSPEEPAIMAVASHQMVQENFIGI